MQTPPRFDLATLEERLAGRRPALFLDYDGTLTPIVERPELAVLAPEMRQTLSALAERFPVVIVSGRGREDVARLVGVESLFYAGSHGFDIAGPPTAGGRPIRHEVAGRFRPALQQAATTLQSALASVPGVLVEDKRFAVAVHYRLAPADRIADIEAAIDRVLAAGPDLNKSLGKKVFELRPAIEWDKGKAVLWLLEALSLDRPEVVPIYIGDDTTDEDAFRALGDRGLTILVTGEPRPTAAAWSLGHTDEVDDLLRRMVAL